ncbi:hypothetical protein [Microcoleus sp. Pol11C3]|uniref:hypothetical protein n=1 Tax=Microcoleus sp. Pol11C3 TaxID=3055390 RepID=UPI0040407248
MYKTTIQYTHVRRLNSCGQSWKVRGLYIFLLPKYCDEINPIELEWQHIKEDELAGKMFDDELELAYAVMDGVEARGKRGAYRTQRIKFKSRHPT